MSGTPPSLVEALAAVIRAKYDESAPDRYPTEHVLAEFILEHATDAGFAVFLADDEAVERAMKAIWDENSEAKNPGVEVGERHYRMARAALAAVVVGSPEPAGKEQP